MNNTIADIKCLGGPDHKNKKVGVTEPSKCFHLKNSMMKFSLKCKSATTTTI